MKNKRTVHKYKDETIIRAVADIIEWGVPVKEIPIHGFTWRNYRDGKVKGLKEAHRTVLVDFINRNRKRALKLKKITERIEK